MRGAGLRLPAKSAALTGGPAARTRTRGIASRKNRGRGRTSPPVLREMIGRGKTSPLVLREMIGRGKTSPAVLRELIDRGRTSPRVLRAVIDRGANRRARRRTAIANRGANPRVVHPEAIDRGAASDQAVTGRPGAAPRSRGATGRKAHRPANVRPAERDRHNHDRGTRSPVVPANHFAPVRQSRTAAPFRHAPANRRDPRRSATNAGGGATTSRRNSAGHAWFRTSC